jgi:hypothetical protein
LEFEYHVFGLSLHANRSIPGLPTSKSLSKTADVEIRLSLTPGAADENSTRPDDLTFTSSMVTDSGEPALRIWKVANGEFLRVDYPDGMQFWLEREGKAIWARWGDGSSVEDAATYLLGPVLGLLLRLRGVTCLHASAVAFGDSAVAFVGDEGAGKSTTAAALARRGHAVITDDIVALADRGDGFFVLPAYPYLCLWPAAVEALYGRDKVLPNFSPNWDKRQLALAENRLLFAERTLSLAAIFLLGERSADDNAPFIETPPTKEAFLSLVANSYATSLLDKGMRAREFELLGRLVGVVPVIRVRPHQDASRIDGLCELIGRACAGLGPLSARASGTL